MTFTITGRRGSLGWTASAERIDGQTADFGSTTLRGLMVQIAAWLEGCYEVDDKEASDER